MSRNIYDLIGLIAAVAFILALKGLSSPKSARNGNLMGAAGATLVTVLVFFYEKPAHLVLIILAILVGSAVGVPTARKVKMTAMPQLVALFNGVGGGAAALVAIVEYLRLGSTSSAGDVAATIFTVIVGCVSFTGSIVTFLKLQELMTTRPVVFAGGRFLIAFVLATVIGAAIGGRGGALAHHHCAIGERLEHHGGGGRGARLAGGLAHRLALAELQTEQQRAAGERLHHVRRGHGHVGGRGGEVHGREVGWRGGPSARGREQRGDEGEAYGGVGEGLHGSRLLGGAALGIERWTN